MAKEPRKPPRKAPPRVSQGPLARASIDDLVAALSEEAAPDAGAAEELEVPASGGGGTAADGATGADGADEGAVASEGADADADAELDAADDGLTSKEITTTEVALAPAAEAEAAEDAEVEARRVAAAEAGVLLSDELPVEPEDDLRDVVGEASPRLVSIIESLLFAAPRPLSIADLRRLLQETSKQQIQLAVKHLLGASEGRGVVVAQVAGGFAMRTHHDNAVWVQRLLQAKPTRLSRSQLETLAIVAYRQPVTRPEVDAIRGVDSGAVLKVLLERELVQIVGKKDEPGRPLLYGTTLRFLEFFNLRSLRDLPTLRDFRELSEESKATLRSRLGEGQAEALGQEVLGFGATPDAEGAEGDLPEPTDASEPASDELASPEPASDEPSSDAVGLALTDGPEIAEAASEAADRPEATEASEAAEAAPEATEASEAAEAAPEAASEAPEPTPEPEDPPA